jgi:hypothetical protein
MHMWGNNLNEQKVGTTGLQEQLEYTEMTPAPIYRRTDAPCAITRSWPNLLRLSFTDSIREFFFVRRALPIGKKLL